MYYPGRRQYEQMLPVSFLQYFQGTGVNNIAFFITVTLNHSWSYSSKPFAFVIPLSLCWKYRSSQLYSESVLESPSNEFSEVAQASRSIYSAAPHKLKNQVVAEAPIQEELSNKC